MNSLTPPSYAAADSVFHSTCLACGLCSMICPTHALHPEGDVGTHGEANRMPRLQRTLCRHCGLCASICPSNTIHQPRLHQLAREIREVPVHTMIFLCRNALVLAGRPGDAVTCEGQDPLPASMPLLEAFTSPQLHRIRLPQGARLEVLRCVHRVGARFIDKLVQRGVRRILMLACPDQYCTYHVGAARRLTQPDALQAVYAAYGINTTLETRRLTPQSSAELQRLVDAFVNDSHGSEFEGM